MAKEYTEQLELFENKSSKEGPVTCLGMTFESDEARREYFTEELRKKLPELRQIEGFPIGEDEDILALSDPPYYTACPNPFINDFVGVWEKKKKELYGEKVEEYHREPFVADVSEGKSDPIYTAHNYHTKVPYRAIMRYILHYTKPGDIILDAFAGTGMTGVASMMCGDKRVISSLGYDMLEDKLYQDGEVISEIGKRHSILNDLSPIATFISKNYNNPVEPKEFNVNALRVLEEVEKECSWMFETNHEIEAQLLKNTNTNVIKGKINYTVWSDVFLCSNCTREIIFSKLALDEESGRIKDEFCCPDCGSVLSKKSMDRAFVTVYDDIIKESFRIAKQVPVLINYSLGKETYTKIPDNNDLEILNKIDDLTVPYWFPIVKIPEGVNTSQPMNSHGIKYIHQFYTKRALYTLAKAFDIIRKLHISKELKDYLFFTFEQAILGFAKISRYVPTHYSQVNQYLSGTLYIGSQVVDVSLSYIIKNKIERLTKLLSEYGESKQSGNIITTQATQGIYQIPSNSIDYIFTDPPFGGNLMYSELNLLWESWINLFTNNKEEAIVNKTQEKGLYEYQSLMSKCFSEYYRVLKPGRWITVEFSNSQASVWNAIQESLQRAGFVISNVSALDKKQLSFKAVTSTVAVKQDLVISAYKPTSNMQNDVIKNQNTEESAWIFTRGHLDQLPIFIGQKGSADIVVERTPRVLFDRMVAYHVQNGYAVPISSAEFQSGLAQRFPMRDGMVFLESQVAEYDKKRILAKEFVQLNLFVSDENSAIEWLRQQLLKKPQTRQDLHPNFMKELQHISKYEKLPELDVLLEQNFLKYDGIDPVPSQIHAYLSTNFKDLRELDKENLKLRNKAKERWYVADPNKQADLEKLREKSLMREFVSYVEEINSSKKKLKQFRLEAIRAGFKKAWGEKDYKTIVEVGAKIPENVLQEDDKLLMYYDNAQIRLGM